MENMGDWEQKNLLHELKQGRELARQLQGHLNVPSSSHETREFLVTKILTSYEKALSMLQWNSSVGDQPQHTGGAVFRMSESPPSLPGSPRGEDSDPEHRDASRKRKAVPRWTQQVRVSPGVGLEVPPDDGCSWRKYGQKEIFGAKYPRGYYSCNHRNVQGCLATKQVQRSDEDPTVFEITYRGRHTCAQASHINPPPTSPEKQEQNNKHQPPQNQQPSQDDQIQKLLNFQTTLKVKTENLDTQGQGDVAVTSPQQDTFDLCHLFQGEQFDDNKDDKIETSISSSLITTISSYADNLDPLDLNEDPPDLAKEAQLQCYEFLPEPIAGEGIEKQITSESQGMVFDVETVEMKSSGEKIGVEF
ncbi:probable WRKY transcription factor 53 [Corylus avellana]|uniref:probable WRKY transcription factor 53 n=1 Tax=Corylus avellana TaxID=13451 RepID=UPI00286C959B|nr:probable WRKY transcription factor 53 [Corylus avellana]